MVVRHSTARRPLAAEEYGIDMGRAIALVRSVEDFAELPFAIDLVYFHAMGLEQNRRVLRSFWNHSWFGELFL